MQRRYTDPTVWDSFDPKLMTLCSPDPQAFRPPEEKVNVLQVRLPTNFKAARFDSDAHTAILRQLESDIEAVRFDTGSGKIELPVKLKVHDSVFVPLAKWSMLIAGNYRCVQKDGMRSIKDAVHCRHRGLAVGLQLGGQAVHVSGRRREGPGAVRKIRQRGAVAGEARPPRRGRLFGGAPNIERVDRLVQAIAAQKGMQSKVVDETVALVDARLGANRKKAA